MSFLKKEITLPKLSTLRKPSLKGPSLKAPSLKGPSLKAPLKMPSLNTPLKAPSLKAPSLKRSAGTRRGGTVVGLEITATQAIAAQARLVDGRIVAERVVARDLPAGLMRDGLVLEPEPLAAELRQLFGENGLPRRVRVGLATPRTILRVIDLPPLDDKDIPAALALQAQDRIPMPLDKAVMDFQTIGLVDTPEGRRLRVVVVVTEREGIEPLLEALRTAGLRPEGIDLSIFAVIRALGATSEAEGPVLYAQLGDLVNIAIAESSQCRFTRQAPQGLALVLARLAEQRGISTEEARAALAEAVDPASVHNPDRALVGQLLNRVASELGSELRAAAEFYASQFGSGAVTRGFITGPLAPLPGFVEALSDASGLDLICGEVAATSPDALGEIDPRVAPVAAGLSVAEVRS